MATITNAIAGATTSAATAAAKQTDVDFNMFLKLLTTQMQNQDPLKPMESTEYTQQLAQFTQVQQSVKQTGTLDSILAQLSTQNMTQATSFIGKTAEFDSAVTGLSADRPAQWSYKADSPVTELTATITDASGKQVSSATITPDQSGTFSWDGSLANGAKAPPGAYTLALKASTITGTTIPIAITTSGRVDDVMSNGGAVTLGVNGAQIDMSKLVKLAG
jgi:flagellar basal-body rod modification protein FlgD